MSVTPSYATVGVFRDRAAAEQALDALYNAGFTHEQVRYSVPEASGGFFDDLKSLFTGQNASGSVANDLADLGLSDEEANYYANEHSKGNIILAVKAPGRSAEVQTILQQYGSLNAQPDTNPSQTTTYTSDTTSESIVTDSHTPVQTVQPITHDTETDTSYQSNTLTVSPERAIHQQEVQPMTTDYNDEVQQTEQPVSTNGGVEHYNAQSFAEQDTPPSTRDNMPEAHMEQVYDQQDVHPVVTDESLPQSTSSTTSTQDETSTLSDTEPQPQSSISDTQPTTTEDAATDPHATSDVMIESETASDTTHGEPEAAQDSYTAESEAAHIPDIQTAQPVATTTDYTAEPHETGLSDDATLASNVPTEPLTNSTTSNEPVTTDTPTQQPVMGTTTDTDELQSLQAQIASLQQQLQDAKAQLQAAKVREEQVRTAREREQQLQTLRQQLQALQAELAATHSELQDTHSRMGQY